MRKTKKHSAEFKEFLVKQVLSGEGSTYELGRSHGISSSLIRRWIKWYSTYGKEGLSSIKNTYTPQSKEVVIQTLIKDNLSLSQACLRFRIPSVASLVNWIKRYTKYGLAGLEQQTKGRPKTMAGRGRGKKKILTPQEELLEELASLRAQNAYLKKLYALIQSEKRKDAKSSSSKN